MPETPARPRRRTGLSPRQERVFHWVATFVVVIFVAGWSYAIALASEGPVPAGCAERLTVNPLSSSAPPEAAVLADLAVRALSRVEPYRGESGALRVAVLEPGDTVPLADTLPGGAVVDYGGPADDTTGAGPSPAGEGAPEGGPEGGAEGREEGGAPESPGIWSVLLREGRALYRLPRFSVITPVPASALKSGRIGSYMIGRWPSEGELPGNLRTPEYAAPRGLIRVDQDEVDVPVSDHFTLGDFLTKGQKNVWPKYVLMSTRLLDKLELTLQELEAMGHPVEDVGIISGFRTPHYNSGGGNTAGRGDFSRHMYGDAMDFYIDNDGDGRMDDLNGDGSVDIGDARVLAEAADRVEQKHPTLIGGVGIYRPTGAHSGFVHVDTRGYRARW